MLIQELQQPTTQLQALQWLKRHYAEVSEADQVISALKDIIQQDSSSYLELCQDVLDLLQQQSKLVDLQLPSQRIICNMLLARRRLQVPVPSKKKVTSLLKSGIFGVVDGATLLLPEMPTPEVIRQIQDVQEPSQQTPQLQNFKCYSEQEPLQVTQELVDHVMDTLTEGSQPVLIKMIMDIYLSGDTASFEAVWVVFVELLTNKQHLMAMELLQNLMVHVQLLEDVSVDSVKRTGTDSLRVTLVTDDLFQILRYSLEWLVYTEVKEEEVWTFALQALFSFIVTDGMLDKGMLLTVDIKVVECALMYAKCSPMVQTTLVRMLVNMLYQGNTKGELDKNQLVKIGGINFILDQYIHTFSIEVRDNLFSVIYDYVISEMVKLADFDAKSDQINVVFEILRTLNAPQFMWQVACVVPDKFVERFVRYVYLEEIRKDPSWFRYNPQETTKSLRKVSSVDKSVLVAILYGFESLFSTRNDLINDMNESLVVSMAKSSLVTERLQAVLFTFQQVQNDPNTGMLIDLVKEGCYQVVIDVIRICCIQAQNQVQVLNRHLPALSSVKDQFVTQKGLNLILQHITTPATDKLPYEVQCSCFGLIDEFIQGRYVIRQGTLQQLNPTILLTMFQTLAPSSETRAVVLQLIVQVASHSMDAVGGADFFKSLIVENLDAKCAYIASQFLVQRLESEKPEQFQMIVRKLASKMQVTPEELQANAYHLIRAIMGIKR